MEVDIRALEQNAAALVARAAAAETVTTTSSQRPVAQMTVIPVSRLEGLIESGRARPARRDIADLPAPSPGPDVSAILAETRGAERY